MVLSQCITVFEKRSAYPSLPQKYSRNNHQVQWLILGTESLLLCYFMYLNCLEIFKHV